MDALAAQIQALVPDVDHPAAVYRARLGLVDRGLAEVDRAVDQVSWLMDGNLPDEIRETFAGIRAQLEETRGNVALDLIQAVALLN